MTAIVLFLAGAALPIWAAYISLALAAETDTRDLTPGRTVQVLLRPEPIELPPMHELGLAYVKPPSLRWLGQNPPAHVVMEVARAAA